MSFFRPRDKVLGPSRPGPPAEPAGVLSGTDHPQRLEQVSPSMRGYIGKGKLSLPFSKAVINRLFASRPSTQIHGRGCGIERECRGWCHRFIRGMARQYLWRVGQLLLTRPLGSENVAFSWSFRSK